MRSVRDDLTHHVTDFCQLVHQVDSVVEPSGGVDQYNVSTLGHRRLYSVESHRGRISAHALLYNLHVCPFGPDLELVNGGSPERVGGSDHHFLAHRLVAGGKFSDGRGLAHTVHSDNHHDKRFLRQVERFLRRFLSINIQKRSNLVTKHVHQFVEGHVPVLADPFLKAVNDLERGVHAHIRRD